MKQQFRTPSEQVRLARIQFGGALVILYGMQGIAVLFFNVAKQSMQFRFIMAGQKSPRGSVGFFELAGLFVGPRERNRGGLVFRLQSPCALQVRQSFRGFALLFENQTKTLICLEAFRISLDRGSLGLLLRRGRR